jgi:hypothetical protein
VCCAYPFSKGSLVFVINLYATKFHHEENNLILNLKSLTTFTILPQLLKQLYLLIEKVCIKPFGNLANSKVVHLSINL